MIISQLETDIVKYESNIPTHIFSRKEAILLFKHNTFILSDYDHNIFVDKNVGRDMIEYYKQLPEAYESDNG